MCAEICRDDCEGCKISQGCRKPPGGIIGLDGDWILNHYDGEEGFLGWMALQPRFHRMKLADLQSNELKTLGENIQKIDSALDAYWKTHFKNDPLQRVYVAYFFESVYDKPEPTKFHLHVHLIPRAKSLDPLLREYRKLSSDNNCASTINAWKIYTLTNYKGFPRKYEKNEKNVEALMAYLRGQLQRPS